MRSSTDDMWADVAWMPHSSLSQTSHVSVAVRSVHANLDCDRSSSEAEELRVSIAVHGMAGSPLSVASSTLSAPPYTRGARDADSKDSRKERRGFARRTHNWYWEQVVQVPIRWKDLPRDAYLLLEVMGPASSVRFRTTMVLFDKFGRLRKGLQRLELRNDSSFATAQDLGSLLYQRDSVCCSEEDDLVWNVSRTLDDLERFEMAALPHAKVTGDATQPVTTRTSAKTKVDPLSFGQIPEVPWLDTILEETCRNILEEGAKEDSLTAYNQEDPSSYLILELPSFDVPVMHEESFYPVSHQGASGPVTALDLSLCRQNGKIDSRESGKGEVGNTEFVPFLDHESESDNPVEDKYRTLTHDLLRGLVDPALKPDREQRARLAAIIMSPSHHPTREEKDLLWRFRFSLVDNRKALTKFLLAVDWTVESEVVQAAELLEQWRKRSPIEVTDALKLLGKNVAFQTSLVRAYAIDTLAEAPDDELRLYLLQLVQALKYESEGAAARLSSNLVSSGQSTNETSVSSLAKFLIDRASASVELANYLYWYLKVEVQDPTHGARYLEVFSALRERLSATPFKKENVIQLTDDRHNPLNNGKEQQRSGSLMSIVDSVSKLGSSFRGSETSPDDDKVHQSVGVSASVWDVLVAQDDFISGIMDCQMKSRDARGKKDAKETCLRDLISSEGFDRLKFHEPVPLPSCPNILVKGVNAHTAKMFKSALYPALIEFRVDESALSKRGEDAVSEKSNVDGPAMDSAVTYKVIVKTGDDLRQDQLVIMMIKLMDGLLKRGTLDLCLKPYSILATSPSSGLVEFVDGSIPISQILTNHNNSILQCFQKYAPEKGAKYDVQPEVMQAYVRSCAGYCVITYILGVGDRHLDNIMLQPTSGICFHIDFGYIFGRDPKPLPPAFRLTREMVDGMGGMDSAEYRQFCSLACQAFNTLRKGAGLVLNLLHLMSDAGIEDLSNNPSSDAEGIITKVEERFRLELTDEQAERFFLSLINDSLAALAPRVMDVFHSFAVSRR